MYRYYVHPMSKGFMYMIAFIDVYSRKIMGWSISNSMSKQWCVAALKEAIAVNGKPNIINSNQVLNLQVRCGLIIWNLKRY
ncbi:MAG: DDE-type integrase/transposase/recombinase [Saprospiraceae bacterium]|nr:DDE-type integrase/transposase/recombinase [Saprospiraceae bacterium]